MKRIIVLDTSVAGLLTNPTQSVPVQECRKWAARLRTSGDIIALPEIADYELRREMVMRRAVSSLRHLNALTQSTKYLPLNTLTLLRRIFGT